MRISSAQSEHSGFSRVSEREQKPRKKQPQRSARRQNHRWSHQAPSWRVGAKRLQCYEYRVVSVVGGYVLREGVLPAPGRGLRCATHDQHCRWRRDRESSSTNTSGRSRAQARRATPREPPPRGLKSECEVVVPHSCLLLAGVPGTPAVGALGRRSGALDFLRRSYTS